MTPYRSLYLALTAILLGNALAAPHLQELTQAGHLHRRFTGASGSQVPPLNQNIDAAHHALNKAEENFSNGVSAKSDGKGKVAGLYFKNANTLIRHLPPIAAGTIDDERMRP